MAMELLPDRFRRAMGQFATGVTVVTTLGENGPEGITVNAISAVSLEPPLLMVALDRRRFITPTIRTSGRYAVNVLGAAQQSLSDCFAHAPSNPGREAFCAADWHPGETGLPLLDGAIGTLECTVVQVVPAGDHDLFIARVEAADFGDEDDPLIYVQRHYLRVERSRREPLEGKPEG